MGAPGQADGAGINPGILAQQFRLHPLAPDTIPGEGEIDSPLRHHVFPSVVEKDHRYLARLSRGQERQERLGAGDIQEDHIRIHGAQQSLTLGGEEVANGGGFAGGPEFLSGW